ncbi:brain-specific serine protease 4-like [Drosophila kikkawai]|uniref:Brain-specific serine protease 4-like n=1 Tax=Drosophila kikkawai TaxID=30033 RepID=A0ABM3C4D8_DROKI|nr:CLIP domain-containing serine protease B15-like [Drosophila kikkawai]
MCPRDRGLCFLILALVLQSLSVFGQNLPYIACPKIFEYLEYQGQYIGHIQVVLDSSLVENVVSVEFSQRGRPPTYSGELNFLENEESLSYRLRNGELINYRVDFPTPGVVPKLIKVAVNGETLCQANQYNPPSVKLYLSRTLRTSVPLSARPQDIPFRQRPPINLNPEPAQRPQPLPQRPQQLPSPIPRPQQTPPQPPRPQPLPQPTQPMTSTNPPTIRRVNNAPQTIGQLRTVCGREKPIQTAFIHFGEVVQQGQFPWMVALLERIGNEYSFTCGGTLISARTVISAAHCFRFGSKSLSADRTVVSLGRNSLDIFSPGELQGVSELVLHQQYDVNTFTDADLALLQLTNQVQFTDYIKPICLWNDNYLLDLPSGHKSYVAGWGEDEHGNKNTRLAKMTSTDIITQTECRGNLTFENVRFVTSNTICASNAKASGPCSGDSGGGLMLEEQDIWMLRGVVSSGQRTSKGCDLTKPVIYTDVARHIDWLLRTMWF